jgi:CheY-like chemotaxis protein
MEIPATRPLILVVASDPLEMTGLSAALHLSGYEASSARGPEPALKAAVLEPFDLVISDVNLEGHSGERLRDAFRNYELNRDTPFLFLSATQTPDVIRRSHQSEGVFYLRKPYETQVLLDLVDRALWLPHLVNTHLQSLNLPSADEKRGHQSPPRHHFDVRPETKLEAIELGISALTEDAWQS